MGSLLAISMLIFSGLIDFRLGVALFIANLIGAHLGSRIAINKGHHFVRYMIILVAVGVIIHLLFFRLQFRGINVAFACNQLPASQSC